MNVLSTFVFIYIIFIEDTCLEKNIWYHAWGVGSVSCLKQSENNALKRDTPRDCMTLCANTTNCNYFTWIPPDDSREEFRRLCCLKEGRTPLLMGAKDKNVVSGPKTCSKLLKKLRYMWRLL